MECVLSSDKIDTHYSICWLQSYRAAPPTSLHLWEDKGLLRKESFSEPLHFTHTPVIDAASQKKKILSVKLRMFSFPRGTAASVLHGATTPRVIRLISQRPAATVRVPNTESKEEMNDLLMSSSLALSNSGCPIWGPLLKHLTLNNDKTGRWCEWWPPTPFDKTFIL